MLRPAPATGSTSAPGLSPHRHRDSAALQHSCATRQLARANYSLQPDALPVHRARGAPQRYSAAPRGAPPAAPCASAAAAPNALRSSVWRGACCNAAEPWLHAAARHAATPHRARPCERAQRASGRPYARACLRSRMGPCVGIHSFRRHAAGGRRPRPLARVRNAALAGSAGRLAHHGFGDRQAGRRVQRPTSRATRRKAGTASPTAQRLRAGASHTPRGTVERVGPLAFRRLGDWGLGAAGL